MNKINYKPIKSNTLKNTTLVMPSVNGIGFLGQLTVDLLIHTLAFERIGYLETGLVEPIVGNCYGDELHTAFEVYQSPKLQLSIVQIRSQVIRGHGVRFVEALNEWIQDTEFEKVVILTGLDKSRRNDVQLNTSPLRYYTNNVDLKTKVNGILEMEPFVNDGIPYKLYLPPGSGLTNFLLDQIKVPTIVFSWFTEVGDNMVPAEELAQAVCEYSSIELGKVKVPTSWNVLYGPDTQMRELF